MLAGTSLAGVIFAQYLPEQSVWRGGSVRLAEACPAQGRCNAGLRHTLGKLAHFINLYFGRALQ